MCNPAITRALLARVNSIQPRTQCHAEQLQRLAAHLTALLAEMDSE